MSCEPTSPPVEPTWSPTIGPAPGSTILVTDSEQPMIRTVVEETDAVGAMRRGLKEYLAVASKDVMGRRVFFENVFEEWAEPEEAGIQYPSAAVLMADGSVAYDAHSFSPTIHPDDLLPDGRFVIKVSEASTAFVVEAYCVSPGDRLGIAMLMEEALNPVDFMYGFWLDLPHYFGQRAMFSLEAVDIPDDSTSARHGLRVLRYRLMASISVVRPRNLVPLTPKLQVDAISPDVVITAGPITVAGNVR